MFTIKTTMSQRRIQMILEERLNMFGIEILMQRKTYYTQYDLAELYVLKVNIPPDTFLNFLRNMIFAANYSYRLTKDGQTISESEDLDLVLRTYLRLTKI